jgi:hypothetical protein
MSKFLFCFYRHKQLIKYFSVIIFFSLCAANAFSQTRTDTLKMAKQYMSESKFAMAAPLLDVYETAHANDLNTIWLYAQAAYGNYDFTTAKKLYDRAIFLFPSNFYLKLDYANKLIETRDFDKADSLLKKYESYDSASAGIQFALAKINYYTGNYKAAEIEIKNVLKQDAGNSAAIILFKQINEANATWLNIGAAFQTDDQPLQSFTPHAEAGTYVSSLFSPFIGFSAPIFFRDKQSYNAQLIQAGNVFHFFKSNFTVKANGGITSSPSNNNYSWTGDLSLTKIFAHHFEINTEASRLPYFETRSSIDSNTVPYNFSIYAAWNNVNSWNGKIVFNNSYFSLYNNNIYSLSGWIFLPPLHFSTFIARVGYAFNYSSSTKNLYTAATVTDSSSTIKGIYDPYFTPDQQLINSVLVSVDYKNKIAEAGIHANAGVYARNMNPYFYFNEGNNNIITVQKGFAETSFFPVQVNAYVLFHLKENMAFVCNYSYNHNIFYTSSFASVSLKINFVHE